MKIAKMSIIAAAGAVLFSGCMTDEPVKQRAADERIELINKSSFKIELLRARTLINDDGLLTVDASALLSRTGSFRWIFTGDPKIQVWYHFDWIDAQGNIFPPVQREMTALPGNILDFHGVAPEEKYINYRLTISLKGPETEEEAAKKQEKSKKQYAETGSVKPAGNSQAKPVVKSNKEKAEPKEKTAEKPVKKAEEKKDAPAGQTVKSEAKKDASKTEPAKPAAEKTTGNNSKSQKLTEPFD